MRWTSEQIEFRSALRRFVDAEVLPLREGLEFGSVLPYDVVRRYYDAFGVGESAMQRFERSMAGERSDGGRSSAESLIPIVEFSRASPGLVAAHGVSVGPTSTAEQRVLPRPAHCARWACTRRRRGELAFDDVYVEDDRLLRGRSSSSSSIGVATRRRQRSQQNARVSLPWHVARGLLGDI
jgi:hypothetical protein